MFDSGLSPSTQMQITRKLLAGLRRAHVRATGFVNEGKIVGGDTAAGTALLEAWLDAGMDLGNHGYSHLSFDHASTSDYIADAARGDALTMPLLRARGRRERWWRYPYLETGTTAEAKKAFADWLASTGYAVAPVTVENGDYLFADAYDKALASGDRAAAAHLEGEYLSYTASIVGWYQKAALELLGRRPALVLLLHASRLNANVIGRLLAVLEHDGLRFESLEDAMRDPAYMIHDPYVGPDGIEWLERWSIELSRELPWGSLPSVPDDVAPLADAAESS